MNKLKSFLVVAALCFFSKSYGQLGVSYHQSNLPFVGINYEVGTRFVPEVRLGTDSFTSDLSLEAVANYKILSQIDYDFYAGLGGRAGDYEGLVIPVGLNFYPFEEKNFGFHIELASIIGESNLVRGSWGIRYRFGSRKVRYNLNLNE